MITFPSSSVGQGSSSLQSVGQIHSSETHSELNYVEKGWGKDICFAGTERGEELA